MHVEIFTDGSTKPKNPGYGGSGSIILFNDTVIATSKNLGGNVTSNQAELHAIKQAFEDYDEYITDQQYDVVCYSDSRYSLNVISGQYVPKKNIELISEIKSNIAPMISNISLTWIRSHRRLTDSPELKDKLIIYWNNMADYLAKEGASRGRKYSNTEILPVNEFVEKINSLRKGRPWDLPNQ